MAKYCPNCGKSVKESTKFCSNCGTSLSSAAEQSESGRKFCRFCGNPVREGAKFCRACGKSLAAGDEASRQRQEDPVAKYPQKQENPVAQHPDTKKTSRSKQTQVKQTPEKQTTVKQKEIKPHIETQAAATTAGEIDFGIISGELTIPGLSNAGINAGRVLSPVEGNFRHFQKTCRADRGIAACGAMVCAGPAQGVRFGNCEPSLIPHLRRGRI